MRGQEKSPVSESLAAEETGLGFESLQSRLQRYGAGKTRALDMAKYITDSQPSNKGNRGRNTEADKLSAKIKSCGSYLLFKHYFRVNEVRLHAMKSCKKHLLCPFCSMRRGAKYLQAYSEKVNAVLHADGDLKPYMVTLTVKDGESLEERFQHLRNSMQRMIRQRRDALGGKRQHIEFCKAVGGVHSVEFKRGEGSGLWHPHVHMVWLCRTAPDARSLSREWREITGDSFIVDVRECYGESMIDAFLEVFKYALKFSDMALADNFHAFQTLQKKRLVDSFGNLRGVEVPDDLTDDDIDNEPYMLLLYKFVKGSGYNFVGVQDM